MWSIWPGELTLKSHVASLESQDRVAPACVAVQGSQLESAQGASCGVHYFSPAPTTSYVLLTAGSVFAWCLPLPL